MTPKLKHLPHRMQTPLAIDTAMLQVTNQKSTDVRWALRLKCTKGGGLSFDTETQTPPTQNAKPLGDGHGDASSGKPKKAQTSGGHCF